MKPGLMKLLIMGLPGAGKTTLAKDLAYRFNAVHFNADQVRATTNKDLGFSIEDRIEHARRMGCMCDSVNLCNFDVIADFVCPTEKTRLAFNPSHIIWMNTIQEGRFEDTNKMFTPPSLMVPDIIITDFNYDLDQIYYSLRVKLSKV